MQRRGNDGPGVVKLPPRGIDRAAVLDLMEQYREDDARYREGKTWSLVYYLGEEHTRFLQEAHNRFFSENGLNPMAFKSLKRFESEVVRMTAGLLHGDGKVAGIMTAGGTESCLLAVKTYRDLARARKPWILRPEMIVPESVHVAFEKAAHYFGVKAVHAPLDRNFRVDVRKVRKLANRNTILIVGSAPSYPHGVVDPIEELGVIAAKRKVPLHVDSCLGGFMLPFVEKLGYPVPAFDFRVPAVNSISADVHKYGFAAKGASTILYRDVGLIEHQMFVYENWPGGIFASAGLLGTRPGGSIAAAWAAMMAMGEEGYLRMAADTMAVTKQLIDGVNAIEGLDVMGKPHMSVFAYRSIDPGLPVYAVGDRMEARGWHIDRQQRPESLHAMVTPWHARVADAYLTDLREAVAEVRANPGLGSAGNAAMYGMIAHVPLRGMVRKSVLKMMTDMYGPDGTMPAAQAAQAQSGAIRRIGMRLLDAMRKFEAWKGKLR